MPFRKLKGDEVFSCVAELIDMAGSIEDDFIPETAARYCDCVAKMAEAAELRGLSGNIWQSWIASLFVSCETPFSLLHERREKLDGTLRDLAVEDLDTIHEYFNYDLREVDGMLDVQAFSRFGDYEPLRISAPTFSRAAGELVNALAASMRKAKDGLDLYKILTKFYLEYGVGVYALYKALRWDGRTKKVVPVTNTEDISLNDIIGYEDQKHQLVGNTLAFLAGRPANNVLLYGESGTGKSSSVKALLNEYAPRGLRMIEIYKHQIGDLELVVDEIKNRNYRFVLFMDDLSFEQFETEYKYLKAFIEGGLEKRPDNVLIYATSNRRHLMKESWADRSDMREDMHESETEQEKMSLVDRFGLMISYYSPEQEEYLKMVRIFAKEYGVSASDDELEHGAVQWELRHGGFSGRSARQFVEFLAGRR